jgi:hypothetical protein
MDNVSTAEQPTKMTAGLDLGDKYSHLCLLDNQNTHTWSARGRVMVALSSTPSLQNVPPGRCTKIRRS